MILSAPFPLNDSGYQREKSFKAWRWSNYQCFTYMQIILKIEKVGKVFLKAYCVLVALFGSTLHFVAPWFPKSPAKTGPCFSKLFLSIPYLFAPFTAQTRSEPTCNCMYYFSIRSAPSAIYMAPDLSLDRFYNEIAAFAKKQFNQTNTYKKRKWDPAVTP